jgi:hypothetical protein
MSQEPNTPEPGPELAGWEAQKVWLKTHRAMLFAFIIWTLVMAVLRNVLDVLKSYRGVVSMALLSTGSVWLLVINFVFILLAWYLLTRFLTFSEKMKSPFPLQGRDFVMIFACALLLPMFLSMDLKLVQVVPGATDLGVQDTSKHTLQDTYGIFADFATSLISNRINPEIDKKIEPILTGYGCEAGVPTLAHEVSRKLKSRRSMSLEIQNQYRRKVFEARDDDDPQLTYQEKASDIARIAIEAFNDLDYVNKTFRNYVCLADS